MSLLRFTRAVLALIVPIASAVPISVWATDLKPSLTGTDVTTFHYGNARLGWNNQETILTPTAVASERFGKLWEASLDGLVYGSPLYLSKVAIAGQERSAVFAATDHNSVYALDATTGTVLWSHKNLAEPISDAQWRGNWYGSDFHGTMSTPVIDRASNTIFICGVRSRGLRQQYEVWALDVQTGIQRPGWPVVLKGEYKGTPFAAGQLVQRGALSLVKDWVYIPFGARGDVPPWHGWVMGVNIRNPASSQRAFSAAPKSDGAGIWSGGGVSANDATGDLFVVTGNGAYDLDKGGDDLSQSVFRLSPTKKSLNFTRHTNDYFTPANHAYMDEQDEDLGGATALVIPDLPETKTPHLIFTGGKDGKAYLLNRDNLGGVGGELQQERLFGDAKAVYHEGIRSTSAYFDAGVAGRFIFVAGDQPGPEGRLGMVALRLVTAGRDKPARFEQAWNLGKFINGPASPVISSNGVADSLLWLVETNDGNNSMLHVYDPLTGKEYYNSNDHEPGDKLQGGRRFTSPTVTDGRVFLGVKGVVCYGLKPEAK